ncbi:hypothetical protein WA026_001825 [Henosepilachna vigintioctopunctata]|uniref:TIR domain-containing protein n=1 Tax=Henosepilachna vigintioctopunctata TaxID=420089 RepID=A0AAW1USA0_9CUCU
MVFSTLFYPDRHVSILVAIVLSFIVLMNADLTDKCVHTSCFCYKDSEEVEYQCPNRYAENKVVIHLENAKSVRVECWNVGNIDSLPNIPLARDIVTVLDCSLSYSTSTLFNLVKVKKLKLENVAIPTYNGTNFFTAPMNDLIKLSIVSTTFGAEFPGISAPNLTMLDFEKIGLPTVKKILKNFPKLVKLNLNLNEINALDPEIFDNFPKLENLVLSKNILTYLHKNPFRNLSSLKTLQLDFNNLLEIDDETFENLVNLIILDISNNDIKNISRKVLKPLKSIENIYIDSNVGIELDDFLFSNFSTLTAVFLRNCGIRYLPKNIFTGSQKIGLISLEYNGIETISSDVFEGLVNLKILNLNDNKLIITNTEIFIGLTNLKILNLQNNEINSLDSNIFKSLSTLEELYLDNNQISHIDNDAFKYNQNLKILYLFNNSYSYKIQRNYFSPSPFSKCVNLEELILSNNLVEDIMDDLLLYSEHLNSIDLSGNKINTAYLSSIWNIARKGVILNLESNHITQFIFDNTSISEGKLYSNDLSLPEKESDSIVLISNNPIICDCRAEKLLELLTHKITPSTDQGLIFKYDELFCNEPKRLNGTKFTDIFPTELICPIGVSSSEETCTSSKECLCFWRPYDKTIVVDCARKNLTVIPQLNVSVNLDYNQTEVHLEDNYLKEAPRYKHGYKNVTKLYLNNNRLNDITWIPPKLAVLDVSNNNLRNLQKDVLKSLNESNFEILIVGNNSWTCDCDINDFLNFIRKNIKKVDVHNIKCKDTGNRLSELTQSDICSNNIVLLLSVFLTVCAICSLSFGVIAFFYKYKQEIKVWLYARNICATFIDEEDLDEDKIFDIFVSYSHKDGDFVFQQLVPRLEKGPHAYKLCLHERDWIPGESIMNNIAYSVMNSRRTLIILSPNFLESVWAKMEFRSAHAEAMRERRNRIILVIKDDVVLDELDEELKIYIKTHTYIKWKDFRFWDRLDHALPHRRNRSFSLKFKNPQILRNP